MSEERTAIRLVTSYGAVGHARCSECQRYVKTSWTYCAHCGARFTETIYERR